MACCKLKRCTACGLTETYETIEYNADGVCNICQSADHKNTKIDWPSRKKKLDALIEEYRGKYDYDCIIPFSGGKDSTFQLYYLKKEYNIKPLIIRFDHGFMRKGIEDNNVNTFKKLGVDVIEFTPNWDIVKRVMLESFRRKTDFCWHCHCGIYSYPIRMAINLNVPLIFWGEPHAELTAYYDYENDEIEVEDEKKFNMFRNLGISADDMFGMIDSPENPVDRRDLLPYTYPAMRDIKKAKLASVCLGSYIPWEYTRQTNLIKNELGWKSDELEGVPTEINTSCEKIECFMQGTRDYIKYMKRGYSRVTQIMAFHRRNGRFNEPGEAEKYIALEGRKPPSLEIFLEYIGLSEDEFNDIVKGTTVPPYEHDYSKDEWAEATADFDDWYREDNRK